MLTPVQSTSNAFHQTIRQKHSLFAILAKTVKVWDKKTNFDKTIAAQVHGSSFVIFNFLENDDFFLELCRIFRIC